MMNYEENRVKSVTFARETVSPPYFITETYFDTAKSNLHLTDWLPILHRHLRDGIITEIIVSGNSCGKYLRKILPYHQHLAIYTVGDLEKMESLIQKAEYYYPIAMACECQYWNRSCNPCTEKRAKATLLYLQNRFF